MTINKVGAIIIKDKKILLTRKRDKFIIPGGKRQGPETDVSCITRELEEELGVKTIKISPFGSFEDDAALDPGLTIKMDVYFAEIDGIPKAMTEIEEILWFDSSMKGKYKLGSIVEKFVIPTLVRESKIN
jgi:8-oxo-dGTP diphosphatase